MDSDNSITSEPRTLSSKPSIKGQNTIIQYLKTQLNKSSEDGVGIHLRSCNVRKVHEGVSSESYSLSWSVMKKISSVFRLRTVSCKTFAPAVLMDEPSSMQRVELPLEEEIRNFIASESGMDRLRRAWYKNRYTDHDTPGDLETAMNVGIHIGFWSFMFAFFKHGLDEFRAYNQRSRTRLFGTPSLFYTRRTIVVTKYGMGRGVKFGLFGFSLAFPLVLIWRGVSIYFNTSSFWTFGLASGTVLSVWKSSLGLRGAFAGFVIGNTLGGFFGFLLNGILRRINFTQQQINYQQVRDIVIVQREYRKYSSPKAQREVDYEDEMLD